MGQITGLIVREIIHDAIFHTLLRTLSCLYHNAKRPGKNLPAAEILASGESIDKCKKIAGSYSEIIGQTVGINICGDSKDQFT